MQVNKTGLADSFVKKMGLATAHIGHLGNRVNIENVYLSVAYDERSQAKVASVMTTYRVSF